MQEQLFAMAYIGIIIAFVFAMTIWYQKGRIDWAKKDIERLQKEVFELQSGKWKSESEMRDFVRSGDRDVREAYSKHISELNAEVTGLRQQLRGKENEKLKESAQRYFDKEMDDRLTRMEKSLREMEKWHREERTRLIDESLDRTQQIIDELNRKRQKPPEEGSAN